MKNEITVIINPENDELCGDCHLLRDSYCKAYDTHLWTRTVIVTRESKRCGKCMARSRLIPDDESEESHEQT